MTPQQPTGVPRPGTVLPPGRDGRRGRPDIGAAAAASADLRAAAHRAAARHRKEATITDSDTMIEGISDHVGSAAETHYRPGKLPWLLDSDAQADKDRRQVLSKLLGVARRLQRASAAEPGIRGPGSDAAFLEAVRQAVLNEGLWLQQTTTAHERRDGLTLIAIDFRWNDIETGQTLGPDTYLAHGTDDGDRGAERAALAALRGYLRHCFLLIPPDDEDERVRIHRRHLGPEGAEPPSGPAN